MDGMKQHPYLLLLLILLLAFPQMSETLITPSLPGIANALDTSAHMIELSLSFFFGGFALGVSIWGIAADRWGRRQALLYGLGLFILGCIACALSNNIWHLLLSTFLQAFGASAGSVVTQTVLRDLYTDKEQRAKVFAIIGMALSFSPALGPLIGTRLDSAFGFQSNYVFLAVLGLGLAVWVACFLQETRPPSCTERSFSDLKKLAFKMAKDPFVILCSALIGLCNGILFCFFAEGPYIFISHLQLTASDYGWIGIVVSLATLLAGFLNHRLAGPWGSEKLILKGSQCMCIGALAYVLGCLYVQSASGFIMSLLLVLPLFVVFLGMGIIISNVLSIALKSYQDVAGSAGSLFGLSYYAVLTCLTGGMSVLHSESILVFAFYLLAMSGGALFAALGLRRQPHQ